MLRKPGFGETNLGAVAGVIVGSVGGLFSVGIAPAIMSRNIALLFATPVFSLISWIICLVCGWLIGGQLGPRLGARFKSERAEIVGGALCGLAPVILIIAWSCWYTLTAH
jgi:uncharacterized membrane protein